MRAARETRRPVLPVRAAKAKPGSSAVPRRAEEELSPFFDLSLDLLCVAGTDGYFRRLNPAWERVLGWTQEELLARPFLEFVHPDDREATAAEAARLAQGAATIAFENRYRGKNGSYRWLQWNARLWPKRQLLYAWARDVTDRRRLEKEILDSTDREKERVGQELHDGLCQNLAGIVALSAMLCRKLKADAHRGAADATEITRLLNENIGYARDLARGLDPVELAQIGLAAALEAFAANVHALFRISCAFRCDRPGLRLDAPVEAHLYRITQQAVNNAVTHGRAKRIEISLRLRGRQGRLTIHDNGTGISRKSLAKTGLGMHTMNYRAHLIGARLRVERTVPRGTAVTCEFPLPSPTQG